MLQHGLRGVMRVTPPSLRSTVTLQHENSPCVRFRLCFCKRVR